MNLQRIATAGNRWDKITSHVRRQLRTKTVIEATVVRLKRHESRRRGGNEWAVRMPKRSMLVEFKYATSAPPFRVLLSDAELNRRLLSTNLHAVLAHRVIVMDREPVAANLARQISFYEHTFSMPAQLALSDIGFVDFRIDAIAARLLTLVSHSFDENVAFTPSDAKFLRAAPETNLDHSDEDEIVKLRSEIHQMTSEITSDLRQAAKLLRELRLRRARGGGVHGVDGENR